MSVCDNLSGLFRVDGAQPTSARITSKTNTSLTLAWAQPSGYTSGTIVSGYNIYRADTYTAPFSKIAYVTGVTRYTDAGLSSRHNYYYRLSSIIGPQASTPSVFSPADISNLSFWLDANDTDTITLNGSNVSQWDDKSGNGNNMSQATELSQPAYSTSNANWNNKNVLQFVVDNLSNNSMSNVLSPWGKYDAFLVCRYNVLSNQTPFTLATADLNGWIHYPGIYNFGGIKHLIGLDPNFIYSLTEVPTGATNYIVNSTYDNTGATNEDKGKLKINSVDQLGAYNTELGGVSRTITRATIGDQLGFNPMNGDIAEIIVYNKVITSEERTQVYDYLSEKWGI